MPRRRGRGPDQACCQIPHRLTMDINDLEPNPYKPKVEVKPETTNPTTVMYPYNNMGQPIGYHCVPPGGRHSLCQYQGCGCPCHDSKGWEEGWE